MTAIDVEAVGSEESSPSRRWDIDWEAVACFTSVTLLVALACGPLYARFLPFTPQPWQWLSAFGAAVLLAVAAAWLQAIADGRLSATPNGEPKHHHISGWSFVLLALATSIILGPATWAATSAQDKASIDANWGALVLFGLAVAFAIAAVAPSWNLTQSATGIIAGLTTLVRPFGAILSALDSLLVFAVAGSAGARREHWTLRYLILFGVLTPCAVLGYWLEPPWGLAPIGWAFLVAVAMSRRWNWVEDDRELAMLNGHFTGPHLRIGFSQDLRDEALLSFMSMFFLVPLALRQAQMAATAHHIPLFEIHGVDPNSLMTWIAFYGTELAKAAPFVDWAEVYQVGGDPAIVPRSVLSQHVVFTTRVLVDLVFLAALLQALAINARNGKQRALFREGTLNRLDPFIEPVEFRKLVRRGDDGKWVADAEAIKAFPIYDPIRLSELSGPDQRAFMSVAAKALSAAQGGADSEEFHDELLRRAMMAKPDKEAIAEVVLAIRAAGPTRQLYELDQARIALNYKPRMVEARTQLMRLLIETPDSTERTRALLSAIQPGPNRDSLGPVRAVAIAGLANQAAANEIGVVAAIREAEQATDSTQGEKREARAILKRLDLA